MSVVEPGSFLTLHYRLAGPQGDGAGELSPVVEQRLMGLAEGARTAFDIPAGEAFGERNPDMIQWLARKELDAMGDPQERYAVGDVIHLPTPDGQGQFAAVVQAERGDGALRLDFNLPLAGQPVTLEVGVIGLL